MSRLSGPHELAWDTMLDVIYADAYHHDIRDIRFELGLDELGKHIDARNGIPRVKSNSLASAWLCAMGIDTNVDRLYTVALSGHPLTVTNDWKLERTYYVLTWKVRLMGILIRFGSWMRQPKWVDIAMYRMRKLFITDQPTYATYILQIWDRKR